MKLPSCRIARPIVKMLRMSDFRLGITLSIGGLGAMLAAPGLHAQALPSTQPTSLPANSAMPAPIVGTSFVGVQPAARAHPAQVTYVDGKLNIRANDSSLNQILRSIAQKTGLKITGGVQDERVFGNYGSAPLSSIIATLLDGTGTNILFLDGDANNPPRLVLTPRGGGATPIGPDSTAYDDQHPAESQSVRSNAPTNDHAQFPAAGGPGSIPQPMNNVNGSPSNTSPTASTLPTTHSVPLDSVPTPSTTPSTSGIVDAPNPPAPGTSIGAAPDGTVTPDQIYQELLKQQKQQQSNPPANSTTPPQP
jgi:hypothetical protein